MWVRLPGPLEIQHPSRQRVTSATRAELQIHSSSPPSPAHGFLPTTSFTTKASVHRKLFPEESNPGHNPQQLGEPVIHHEPILWLANQQWGRSHHYYLYVSSAIMRDLMLGLTLALFPGPQVRWRERLLLSSSNFMRAPRHADLLWIPRASGLGISGTTHNIPSSLEYPRIYRSQ